MARGRSSADLTDPDLSNPISSSPMIAAGRPWGLQLYGNLSVEQVDRAEAGWIRVPLLWDRIEPVNTTPDNYQWPASFDQQIAQLSARGIKTILTLKDNPSWAATYGSGPIDKVNISELVQFMTAAVAHYSAAPYNVKYWEIYNEPDNTKRSRATSGGYGYFGDIPDVYVDHLAAIYGPMKNVDSGAKIVFGGVAYDNWVNGFAQYFVDGVMQNGGAAYFDVFNFHYFPAFAANWEPYGPGIIGKTTYLRDKLSSFGVSKPFICTETCMWSDAAHGGSDELQSRYVTQTYARSLAADLDVTIWWLLWDHTSLSHMCGLLNQDGSPKPAHAAYQTVSRQLSSASYVRTLDSSVTESSQIEAYEFAAASGSVPVIVAWTVDGSTRQMSLDAERIVVVDKFGSTSAIDDGDDGQLDGRVQVSIDPSPVYLRFQLGNVLTISTIGQGVVERDPSKWSYVQGELVTLTPKPEPGWSFADWSGPDVGDLVNNGDGTWSLAIDSDKALTATFAQDGYNLAIDTVGDGSVSHVPGNPYAYSEVATLEPIPDLHWEFNAWSGSDAADLVDNGDGTWSLTMDSDKAVTATFVWGGYKLTIDTAGNGSVSHTPGNPYLIGEVATLEPIADPGWSFAGWSGSNAAELVDNGDGTWSLTMDGDKAVTAGFTQNEYNLTVDTVGNGSVNHTPGNPYVYREVATLKPIPDPGWSLAGWSGPDAADLSDNGDGTWSLTMDNDKALTATFTLDEYNLTLDTVGNGSVSHTPGGPYRYGEVVTLEPIPDPGWRFNAWSGPDAADLVDNGDGTWSLTMDSDKALTARLIRDEEAVTLTLDTIGNGSVQQTPGNPYLNGEVATLVPVPDPGWVFHDWTGPNAADLVDNGDGTWSLTMDGDKAVTAKFTRDWYEVKVTIMGQGVVRNTPGNPYLYFEAATLRPTPTAGWIFGGWSGPDAADLSDNGDGTWSVRMNEDKEVTASFLMQTFLPLLVHSP
ncbi:hypothetical protein ACFLYD_00245 [Chloroflexota bacterium]